MPKLAGQVAAYWGAMGLLAYGVSSGVLPLDEWFWPKTTETDRRGDVPADIPPPVLDFDAPEPAAPPVIQAPTFAAPVPQPLAKDEQLPALPADEDETAPVVSPTPRRTAVNDAPRLALRVETTPAPAPAAATPPRTVVPREFTPRSTWNEPSFFGPATPKESRRVMLMSPDASRGSRHIDDSGDWLFPEDESPRSRAAQARTPIARTAKTPFIDSRDAPINDEPVVPPRALPTGNVGSCEAAAAAANDVVDMTTRDRGPADITRDAYANLLNNGRYLSSCRIPSSTRFEICAAVRDGRAVGVTVTASPANAALSACIRSAVTRLSFPVSPRLDVTRTRFDAAR